MPSSIVKNSKPSLLDISFENLIFRIKRQLLSFVILIFSLVFISACGGGKKTSSSASGNAILPSAPKLDPPAIVFPPSNNYPSNTAALNISGTCTPSAGSKVYLGGDENQVAECQSDGTFSFIVENANDGTFNYTLRAESLTEHPSDPVAIEWRRSSEPPSAPTVTQPATLPLISSDSTISIAGACDSGGTVSLSGDSSQNTSCDSNGLYSFSVTKSVDGTYSFSISQTNEYGNQSSVANFSWTRNTAVPSAPIIATPVPNPYTSSDSLITVTGTCTISTTLNVSKVVSSVEQLIGTTLCSDGTFSFDISELIDGTYNYVLKSVSVTNIPSSNTSFQWIRSAAVPSTPILTSPNPSLSPFISNSNTLTVAGSCDDGNTVYLTGDSTQSTSCSSSSFSFTVTKNVDAVYSFGVYQQQASTPSGGVNFTWTRDTSAPIAPVIALPGASPYYSNTSSLVISGACETGATVTLSGDNSGTTTCAGSGFSFSISKSADSTYNFSLSSTDIAGNTSSSTSQQWIRDTVAPSAPGLSTPASSPYLSNGSSLTISGSCETNNIVYLTGASTQNTTCTSSSYSFSVSKNSDGTYNFEISQTDLAGSTSPSINATWTRDTQSPSAPTILNPNSNPYTSSNTNLTISGSCESGATVNYSGSSSGSTSCSSSAFSFTVTKNSDGTYNFDVGQTDAANNSSSATAFQWIRDNSVPSSPSISSPNSNPYYGSSTSLTISGGCTNGYTVQLSGSSSQSTICSSGAFSFSLSNSTDGSYNYSLVQISGSNISSSATSFTWNLDRISPSAPVVTSPNSSHTYSSANSLTFSGTCESNSTIQYSGSSSGSTSCASGNFSFSINKASDGSYPVAINQMDQAGNISTSTTITWHRDSVAPATPTITSPTLNPYVSGDSNITISGSCESSATVNLTGDSTQSTTCSNLLTYSFTLSNTVDTTYNYSITQTDLASNTSSSFNFQWIRDTTIPFTPVVTSPTQTNYYSNSSSLSISVTCQTGLTPTLGIVTLTGVLASEVTSPSNSLTQNCSSSPVTFVIQKSSDGVYNLSFNQENPNNSNVSADSNFTWNRDTSAPSAPTVTNPSTSPYTGPGNITLSGGCENNATVHVSGSSTLSQTCTGNSYSFDITKSDDQTYTFNINQVDLAGNTSSTTTQTWIRNSNSLPPPSITFPTLNPYSSNETSLSLSGTCTPNYTVTLGGDINASEVTTPSNSLTQTCTTGGTFSYVLSKSSDNTYSFELTQSYNSATSSVVTFSWTRDTQAPSASISTTASNPNLVSSIAFSFSTTESASFQCKINSGSYQTCISPVTFSGLTNGSSTFYIIATDSVGNIGSTQTYSWTQAGYNTVALYHMDSLSGSTMNDSGLFTSNGLFTNNITASGSPTLDTNGKLPSSAPKSYKLGTSKYFSLANNNSINSMKETMTLEAIFNFSSITSTTGQYYTLFSNSGSSGNYGWELRLERSGSCGYVLKFIASLDGTTQNTVTSSCFAVSASTSRWYYTALTWNKGTVNLYMSRTSATSRGSGVIGTAGSSVLFASTANFIIGAGSGTGSGSSLWLTGSVDEVRLSNTVRSITSYPSSPFTAD